MYITYYIIFLKNPHCALTEFPKESKEFIDQKTFNQKEKFRTTLEILTFPSLFTKSISLCLTNVIYP